MGRIGFLCRNDENELDKALDICRRDSLIHEGIFTHFAAADEGEFGKQYTSEQFSLFNKAIEFFEKNGVKFELRHCANSAATLKYPEYHLDMVRAGIILYGLSSCEDGDENLELRPVMSMRSVISHIKELKKGESVSYGRIFTAERNMRKSCKITIVVVIGS
jgi:alanine racemase